MREKLVETITARELIEALQEIPPDATVAFASDFGDHCHTEQLHPLEGHIEKTHAKQSAYSDSGWAVDNDPENTPQPLASGIVWVIR